MVESGGGVMFAGLVLFIERKNIRAGKPSQADWFTMLIERKNICAGKPTLADWFTIFTERVNELGNPHVQTGLQYSIQKVILQNHS